MALEQKYLDLIRISIPQVDDAEAPKRLSQLFDLVVSKNQHYVASFPD